MTPRKSKKLRTKTHKKRSKFKLYSGGKNNTTIRQLEKVKCSPKQLNELNNFTCYTDKSLYKLRDMWNNSQLSKLVLLYRRR